MGTPSDNHAAVTPRRRIYLVRHGDVTYFDENGRPFYPGTVPLNDEGRCQAEAAARELSPVPIDRVVASDLARAVETAQILTSGRRIAIETTEHLREIQPGRLADLPPEHAVRAFVGAFTSEFDRGARFLGGETYGSLADRVLAYVRRLFEDLTWRHLLIVAHGGVNRVILAHALGLELRGFGALEQDPGGINIVDVAADGRCVIRLVNYTPYNPVKVGLELTTMERLYQQYRAGG
jgi:probable phosphoglycerate mutase